MARGLTFNTLSKWLPLHFFFKQRSLPMELLQAFKVHRAFGSCKTVCETNSPGCCSQPAKSLCFFRCCNTCLWTRGAGFTQETLLQIGIPFWCPISNGNERCASHDVNMWQVQLHLHAWCNPLDGCRDVRHAKGLSLTMGDQP